MTVTRDDRVDMQVLTRDEALALRDRLLHEAGRTLPELRRQDASFELDARERTLLADIEGLEWIIGH